MTDLAGAFLLLAALDGAMAVIAGAFGAHGAADPGAKELLRIGAQYQLVHAVAALVVRALPVGAGAASLCGWLFAGGGLLFGGSLYLLALSGVKVLGAITPLGGLLMILGWGALLIGLLRPAR
jgi:uncharacterized membrane protein YgdD (TMEM256/DUF423 family)